MSGIAAGGFDPTANINFTGKNTFTNTQTFEKPALIEGAVVQTVRHHHKSSVLTNTNGTANVTGNYINLSKSPSLFFVEITPYSSNSYLRVSVVANYSLNNGGQFAYWVAGRLFRNDTEIADALNDRSNQGGNTQIAERARGWIVSTAGQDVNDNVFQSNFVRQISGIYLDENPTTQGGKVKYSLAIRQAMFNNEGSFTNTIVLNEAFVDFATGNANTDRPCGTSYIQVEEIYHA